MTTNHRAPLYTIQMTLVDLVLLTCMQHIETTEPKRRDKRKSSELTTETFIDGRRRPVMVIAARCETNLTKASRRAFMFQDKGSMKGITKPPCRA